MDTSDSLFATSSKVIIQCTDPDDLFNRLEPRLSARSPLRNLHWKAPNRPLRSISNLNISLNREDKSASAQANARRHQIPGLRETPYIKLYLLRCDDKETYKEKAKKEVRQWVKAQTSSTDSKSSSKSQEGHDAFEWMILHVVLPNTPAASQPRSSKHISLEASESTDSVNSKSKWSGKAPSTVFDKLRTDFGGSKSSPGRVAQIRLLEPGDKSTPLTASDLEEQWQDFVDGLKSCILRSFDARVAQYESDIRERDSQRHLPGWNFCTFFLLKEGLAKGFENLGLLDDALAVYDELSLGLDVLVKDRARGGDNDDSGGLLTFSKESKGLLRAALDTDPKTVRAVTLNSDHDLKRLINEDRNGFPFDIEKKNYRNLILSNDVSALDLRIYLFTRELEILSRQAQSEPAKSTQSASISYNLAKLADIVERATQFISLASRSLRFELYHAWGGQEGLSEDELRNQHIVTGNIVASWQWKGTMQILARVLPTLNLDVEHCIEELSLDIAELSQNSDSEQSIQPHEISAKPRRFSLGPDVRSPSRERSQERSHRNSLMPNGASSRQSATAHSGFPRLNLWVSKLVLMARRVLENLEATKAWAMEMKQPTLSNGESGTTGAKSNGEIKTEDEEDRPSRTELLAGLESTTVQAAASSKHNFTTLYIMLSVFAYRTVSESRNRATSQQILSDLVEMEYSQGNFTIAVRYLKSIFGPLPRFSYRPSDGFLLHIYADCLRNLDRPGEYARCLISCLHHTRQAHALAWSNDPMQKQQHYIDQLFQVLPNIPHTTLPAASLFNISAVSRTISPLHDRDGFTVAVKLSLVSGTRTPPVNDIKLRLVSRDGIEPRYITLSLRTEVVITAAGTTVTLETPVTSQGWYTPDELELSIGNLRLLHHLKSGQEDDWSRAEEGFNPHSAVVPLLVYPSYRSFAVKMYPFPIIHLAEVRRLLLQLRPGHNNVGQCKLRLRTATAGLRLNIHDSKLVGEKRSSAELRTAREGDALLMILNGLAAESVTDIEIPYTMEILSEPAVTLRVEVTYDTDQGTFTFYDTLFVKVILPVTVNVQDVFREECLYSKFTISPSTMVPLRLIGCRLEDNELYDLTTGGTFDEPFVVFPKQPANWTVRLIRRNQTATSATGRMTLVVDFQSLDGVIFAILETRFVQDILKSDYAFAARLLASHLVERVRSTWTEQDVEVAGLLQEFEVWKMEDMEWPLVLCAFDKATRANIERWLHEWHSQTPPIKFSSSKVPQRQLKLFVDVPERPILVSAFLDIQLSSAGSVTATIGQPVMADLVMKLEKRIDHELEGSFELAATSDSWLIGGRRKGNVQLTAEPTRLPVVLFPQHLGHLLFPTISVRCRRRNEVGGREELVEVATDVYNPAHGRSVLVTPDLQSSAVEVFAAVPDEGAGRLIASESRGGVG